MRLVGKKKKFDGFLLQRKELLTVGAASALGWVFRFLYDSETAQLGSVS